MLRRSTPRACLALVLLAAVTGPWLTGCAQLGIAKADDVAAMETRLNQANGATNDKVDTVSNEVAQIDPQLQALTAQMDSLSASVAAMNEMMKDLNIQSIAKDAHTAAQAASTAEMRLSEIAQEHLHILLQRQEMIEAEIKATKQLMAPLTEGNGKDAPKAAPKKATTPPSGGGTSGGSGGGG